MPAPELASFIINMRDESIVHSSAIDTGAAATVIFAINSDSALIGDSQAGITGPRLQILAAHSRFNPNPAPPTVPAVASVIAAVNDWLRLDVSGGAFAQTLPDAGTFGGFDATGQMILVKETSGTAGLTVAPAGGDTIDGAAAAVTVAAGGAVLFISDGVSDWSRVGDFTAVDRYAPPEKWDQQNVAASQTDVDLTALVSTSFDTIKMIRAGSIVGLSTRFTAAITDATVDSAVVTVTINGAAGTLELSHSSGVNPSGGEATQGPGIDTFVAGDLVGIQITTLGTFAPTSTDIEAWLEVETA
jgi:hypothetical protein